MLSSNDNDEQEQPPPKAKSKSVLASDQGKQITSQLLTLVKPNDPDHKLKMGSILQVAKNFNVCPQTISRTWKKVRQNFHNPNIAAFC
jgi:hypothetical protein